MSVKIAGTVESGYDGVLHIYLYIEILLYCRNHTHKKKEKTTSLFFFFSSGISFQVGSGPSSGATDADGGGACAGGNGGAVSWSCLWKTRPANPVAHLAYSPDGTLFATAGRNDRLVRVWYQNQQRERHPPRDLRPGLPVRGRLKYPAQP